MSAFSHIESAKGKWLFKFQKLAAESKELGWKRCTFYIHKHERRKLRIRMRIEI